MIGIMPIERFKSEVQGASSSFEIVVNDLTIRNLLYCSSCKYAFPGSQKPFTSFMVAFDRDGVLLVLCNHCGVVLCRSHSPAWNIFAHEHSLEGVLGGSKK